MKPLSFYILHLAAMMTIWIVGLFALASLTGLTLDLRRVALIGAGNAVAYLLGVLVRDREKRRRRSSPGYEDPLETEIGKALSGGGRS